MESLFEDDFGAREAEEESERENQELVFELEFEAALRNPNFFRHSLPARLKNTPRTAIYRKAITLNAPQIGGNCNFATDRVMSK